MKDGTQWVKTDQHKIDRHKGISIRPVPGGYELLEAYRFTVGGMQWTIQAGFRFDGASIPGRTGVLWAITYPPGSPIVLRAALVHDWLCTECMQVVSVRQAADLFRAMLLEDGARAWKAWAMWLAVRMFGPRW